MNLIDINLFKHAGHKQHQTRFDYDGSNRVIYIGVASIGVLASEAAWEIVAYTYTGDNVTLIQAAPLNSIWDNRTTLSYT